MFLEEEIIKKREELSRERVIDSENGIYLGGEVVRFERREIVEGNSILLPSSFGILPEERAMVKYPSSYRPEKIYSTFDETVNLGFTIFPSDPQVINVLQTTNQVKEALEESKDAFNTYVLSAHGDTKGNKRQYFYDYAHRLHRIINKDGACLVDSEFDIKDRVVKSYWRRLIEKKNLFSFYI